MSLSMETSNWTNSEFWSSTLPKIRCESCDSSTCHHVYMSGTTYNMMTHFDSNNNNKIKNENNCFRTKRQRILDLENDLTEKDQGNILEEEGDDLENNGLRIKTRRFTLDFEDIYDYSMKIKLETRTT